MRHPLRLLFLVVLVLVATGAAPASAVDVASVVNITPCRLIQTSLLNNTTHPYPYGGNNDFAVDETRTYTLPSGIPAGNPCAGKIPAGVAGLLVNITAQNPSGNGNVQTWPGTTPPAVPTSILNFRTAANIANSTLAGVTSDQISFKVAVASTHLIVDVLGYSYASGGSRGNTFLGSGLPAFPAAANGNNTAVGTSALEELTSGTGNTALGAFALTEAAHQSGNTAVGFEAMENLSGAENTAVGARSLRLLSLDGCNQNTAVGHQALASLNNGIQNTAVGKSAFLGLFDGTMNVAVGHNSGLGLFQGHNNIYLGSEAPANENNSIPIGQVGNGSAIPPHTTAYIAGVHGVTSSGGVGVFVNAAGKLGTTTSTREVKEDIAGVTDAQLEALSRLRPVSFRYDAAHDDGSRLLQYGLIAEEVAAAMPELAVRDADGKPATVRYHLLAPLLLAALQRQQAQAAERDAAAAAERDALAAQLTQLRGELVAQRELLAAQAATLAALRVALAPGLAIAAASEAPAGQP
jgi:hypothetical protein